jgi:hypothetical protein
MRRMYREELEAKGSERIIVVKRLSYDKSEVPSILLKDHMYCSHKVRKNKLRN